MFLHNFKYSLKTLLRSRMLIFWTLAFPIFLGLFFNMAFSDIEDGEKFSVIDVAVVDDENLAADIFVNQALASLGDEDNEDRLFNIEYADERKAASLLEEGEITGYIICRDGGISVKVAQAGVEETIIRYAMDEIQSMKALYTDLPGREISFENPTLIDVSRANMSYTMIEYYTLIAMTCLYGGMLTMVLVNYRLANMSDAGKRTAVSPARRGRVLLGSLSAGYVVQMIGIILLFAFTSLVLKVDYGDDKLLIFVLAMAGSLAGLSIGVAVAVLVKAGENAKTGILISITMLGCFLSGMMGITMKYVVDKNAPIINMLNPANMITDGLYALYYYDTPDRYIFNVICLLAFSAAMMAISARGLRRQRYDSI